MLHRLFHPLAWVKASRRSVPIVAPCMWKYQLTAAVPAGTACVSSLVYPAVLGEDVSRNMNHEPPCAFVAPVEDDGVLPPRFHMLLPLFAQPHRPLSKVHLAPVFDITTESMAMSPVKLEPASPTKLTLATPLGRATCDAGAANADYC